MPYVTSSAWIRIRPGLTAWMPAWKRSRSTSAELLGIRLLQARIEELPERTAAADEVLPEPALRLVDPERARPAGREPLEMLRLLMAVEAVAVLVHRREERLERVRVVVRRDPDVVAARAGGEGMLGRVDPPAVGAVPEEVDHLVRERALALGREVSVEERVVDVALAELGDELDERRLQLVEQRRAPRRSSSAARSRRAGRRSARPPRRRRSRRTGASARRCARATAGTRRSPTPPSPSPRPGAPRRRRGPSRRAATPARSPPSRSRGARARISAASSESGSSESSSGAQLVEELADRGIGELLVHDARAASRTGRRGERCRRAASSSAGPSARRRAILPRSVTSASRSLSCSSASAIGGNLAVYPFATRP